MKWNNCVVCPKYQKEKDGADDDNEGRRFNAEYNDRRIGIVAF